MVTSKVLFLTPNLRGSSDRLKQLEQLVAGSIPGCLHTKVCLCRELRFRKYLYEYVMLLMQREMLSKDGPLRQPGCESQPESKELIINIYMRRSILNVGPALPVFEGCYSIN